jgi:hypothetical protein
MPSRRNRAKELDRGAAWLAGEWKMKSSEMSKPSVIQVLATYLFFLAGTTILVFGVIAVWRDHPTAAMTYLGAGVLMLLASMIDRFESIKGFGVEAKVRILDRKLEEADETLARVRTLGEAMSDTVLGLAVATGRWDSSLSQRELYLVAERIRSLLVGLGASPEKIREILTPWARTASQDAMFQVLAPLRKAVVEAQSNLQRQAVSLPDDPSRSLDDVRTDLERIGRFLERYGLLRRPPLEMLPDVLLRWFEDVPVLDEARLAPMKRDADEIAIGMVALRDERRLPNPERWLAVLDRLPVA